jgi:hypothetical protein
MSEMSDGAIYAAVSRASSTDAEHAELMEHLRVIEAQVCALDILDETEKADIDFFLLGWSQCTNDGMRRALIKSVRRQTASVAASEAVEAYRKSLKPT